MKKLEIDHRLAIQVKNKIIIELKAVEVLNDVHLAPILTYMVQLQMGMLINFNETP